MVEFIEIAYQHVLENYRHAFGLAGRLGIVNISLTFALLFTLFKLPFIVDWHSKKDESFFKTFFPKSVYLNPGCMLDNLHYVFFFVPILGIYILVQIITFWGNQFLPLHEGPVSGAILNGPKHILFSMAFLSGFLTFFFRDFFSYVYHWSMHKVNFLWKFHKVHHSTTELVPTSAYRVHIVEFVYDAFALGLGHVCANVVFFNIFNDMNFADAGAVRTIGFTMFSCIYMPIMSIKHLHKQISFGPIFNKVLVSPAYHRLHHGKARELKAKNFALFFPIFDLIFGTYQEPNKDHEYEIGIENPEDYTTLMDLIWQPFKEFYQDITNKKDNS